MSSQNATVLLSRLLSLKENSSFHLILDSLTQSSYYLVQEYVHHLKSNKVIYLSFETVSRPHYASEFIDCAKKQDSHSEIILAVQNITKSQSAPAAASLSSSSSASKTLIVVDSLNYIASESLAQFIASIVGSNIVVVATFHTNCVAPFSGFTNYPSSLALVTYIASTIFEVEPLLDPSVDVESLERQVARLKFPVNAHLNDEVFKVVLTNRRKSGRSVIYQFIIDSKKHSYELFTDKSAVENNEEDEELLKDLTTFNLTTSNKQKLAREQVELPFMQAQEALGSTGGAIVYEYEKDDDYDEEDPYEDPF
ncbi:uncharacterized protein LODBEIA_P52010 [Lodderomyces beijingensis]|uniref:Elongator complex protein 5 n=1 Tax=Lodderomyces beijingensis TaxID=1775926 RepID=A0ABP0ZS86_9ASCO